MNKKETEEKIRNGDKRIELTENHKEKIRLANIGKKLSIITKRKISESNIGRVFTKEHKKKIGLFRKNKKYSEIYGTEKSKDIKKKLRLSHIGQISFLRNKTYEEVYGKDQTIEVKNKIGLKSKERWNNPEYKEKTLNAQRKGLEIKPNNPEKIMIRLIEENNLPFNFVGDGKIWFTGETQSFNPDFLSKNPKHIIEVYGDYWHNLPKAREKDKERIKTYSKYGYKTLVIWEHELKNPIQVINKINKFMMGI